MDYFQGVVTEFLRADRAMFVNTEYLIQLEPGSSLAKGRHWYCDALAINFKESTVHLCEVSYSHDEFLAHSAHGVGHTLAPPLRRDRA
jgi:hypothetical protein